jgi:hypothetical protein
MTRPAFQSRRLLWPAVAVLCLVGACLDTGTGDGCACRGTPPPPVAEAEAEAEGAPAATTTVDEGAARTPAELEAEGWNRIESRAGTYVVHWRLPDGGEVPRNEDFELEVRVLRDGEPVEEARLAVDAWMPDHGHGMLRRTAVEARGDGSFHVEGMLLHMRGLWLLRFDVLEDVLAETAECELTL